MKKATDLKILIVDDLKENIIALEAVLKKEKYKTFAVNSGKEALHQLKQQDFGLILLDVQMPIMSGFEVADEIKSNPATHNIPIIFLTANSDKIDLSIKGYKAGGLDYLTKPINTDLLLLKIDNFLNLSFAQTQLEEANRQLKIHAKESEMLFENLFYTSPNEIFIIDEAGIIKRINRVGKLTMGVYPTELIGKHIGALPLHFEIESGTQPGELFDTIMSNGIKGETIEVKLTKQDGSFVYYEIIGNIFHNTKLERFLQINIRDITKKKEIKLKLSESEEKYQAIVEDQSELICRWNFNNGITFVNEAVCRYLNLPKEELIGRSWQPFVHPDDLSLMNNCISSIDQNNPVGRVEHRILLPGNKIRWVEFRNHGFFDKNGNLIDFQSVGTDITDKKQIEESLQIKNAAIESSITAISLSDLEGNITYINKAFTNLWGYEAHEVIGKKTIDFWEDHAAAKIRLHDLKNTNGIDGEFIGIGKNGKRLFIRLSANVVKNSSGVPICYMGSFIDISESKLAESKLRKSEERLIEAQNVAKIGSWELDLINNELIWSDEQFRIFDVNKEKFGASYEAFLEIIHPDDRYMVDHAYINSLETKSPYKITHRLKYKDGTIKYVEEQCETFYNEKGNPIKSVGTTQDVTEKVLADMQLKQSEERFDLAMKGANDGLWDWNLKTNEVYFSPRWKSMIGYAETEIDGTVDAWAALLHKDDKEITTVKLQQYLEGKINEYEVEFRLKHKNGSYVNILARGIALRDNKGRPYRMVGTHTDITDRKRSENFLKLINEGINVKTGSSFFAEFTTFCCAKLHVKCALVGYYVKGENSIQTVSFNILGKEQPNIKYNLENTPCSRVITSEVCYYPDNIQKLFPKDEYLVALNAYSYYGMPLTDENNTVLGILVLLDDKPMPDFEEKQKVIDHLAPRVANELNRNIAQNKLKESEAFTKGILDSLTSHIAVVDENGEILMTNNAWNTFSLNNGELDLLRTGVGANYFEACNKAYLSGDEIAGKVLQGMNDVLTKKIEKFTIEYPCHSRNEERWFLLTVTNYISDTPKVVVRHIDITDRRITEQKMKMDSEILAGISDAVVYSDLDLNVIEWSNNAMDIYGWTKSDILGKKYPDHLNFKFLNDSSLDKMIIKLIKDGRCKAEIEAVTKNNAKIYVSVNTSLINNIDGVPVGIVSIHRDITEKLSHEKALERSELNYKELFEQSPFGIITLDTQGRIQSVNNKTAELTGYSKYKFIGKHFFSSPFNANPIGLGSLEIFEKIIRTEESFTFEALGKTQKDTIKHYEMNARYIKEIQKISLIIRDITSLKNSEKFNTMLYNITSFANSSTVTLVNFCAYLQDQLAIYFNTDNFCVTGYNNLHNELEFIYYNDDQKKQDQAPSPRRNVNGLTEYIIKNKKPILLSGKQLHQFYADNNIIEFNKRSKSWMGVPLIAGSGSVGAIAVQSYANEHEYADEDLDTLVKICNIVAPIIEKLKNDRKLWLINSAIEAAGDGVFITNPSVENNPIIFANNKFLELTGYDIQELFGKNKEIMLGPKSGKHTIEKIRTAIKNKQSFQSEVLLYKKDGSTFWSALTINPVLNESGEAVNFIGIQNDITVKKEMERLLIEKNKELELFMYRASHDLKGPMSTTKGLLRFAIDECRDNNLLHYLHMIEKSNGKLESILSDLMEIVLIREGTVEKTETKLDHLIKEITEEKEIDALKQQEIKLILDITIPETIQIDVKLLKIILRNVFNNAVKYSDSENKGSYINVSATSNNKQLEIIIADNGIGINAKFLPKVFDMFYRATDSSTGTGLGLYIAKNAIDKLNGTISIQSKEKIGTTVTINIPV